MIFLKHGAQFHEIQQLSKFVQEQYQDVPGFIYGFTWKLDSVNR